jgi:hypothetical protein
MLLRYAPSGLQLSCFGAVTISFDPIPLGSIYHLVHGLWAVLTEERKMDDHPSSATVSTAHAALAEVFIDQELPGRWPVNWRVA